MRNNINTQTKKTKILNYINVFRGLAILLIIMGHTMQFKNPNPLLNIINCEIICGGTALFIFISGFLFQHLSYKFEYKNYLSKKWTNVIMPYLITSIPGIILCLVFPAAYKNSFDGLNPFLQIPMFLSVGRVHNTPTWFIPMILLFFLVSALLIKLEKRGVLYKFLPILFLITLFVQRGNAEYSEIIGWSYSAKYLYYLKYVILGYIHFFSMYVFGMYCSKNKEIIDIFFNKRLYLWLLFLLTSIFDIYLTFKYSITNYTISKIFMTMLLLSYLKHFDDLIMKHNKINKMLDFIAKYSFGLFFIHWYVLFLYNKVFSLFNVINISNGGFVQTFAAVAVRFAIVSAVSVLILFISKKILLKINSNINTRMFLGI